MTCKSSWGRLSFSNICFGGVTADGWYPKKDKTYPTNLCRLNLAHAKKKGWWKTRIKTNSSGHCLNTRLLSLTHTHTQFTVSSVVSFDVYIVFHFLFCYVNTSFHCCRQIGRFTFQLSRDWWTWFPLWRETDCI